MSGSEADISYEDFKNYISSLQERSACRDLLIPTCISTRDEFDAWWSRVSRIDRLKERWILRITQHDAHMRDIENQIESLRRAA